MKQGLTLNQLQDKLSIIEGGKHDEIVKASTLKVHRNTIEGMALTETAHRQIAEKTGIPWAYYARMTYQEQELDLLEHNIRAWLERIEGNVMLRCITLQNGLTMIRAIKSDSFLRLDCYQALAVILQALKAHGGDCAIESADVDQFGDRMIVKVTTADWLGEVQKGDLVRAGLSFMTSDTGMARLLMALLLFRLVCSNGMVIPVSLFAPFKRIHRGSKQDLGRLESQNGKASEIFAEFKSQAEAALGNDDRFSSTLDALRQTTRRPFVSGTGALRVIGENYGLQEKEQLEASHLLEGNTQFDLIQAITRHSHAVKTYGRAHELEEMGGKLITLTEGQWKPIGEAKEQAA